MSWGAKKQKVLIAHIIGETDNPFQLQKKEDGFRAYFTENNVEAEILRIEIQSTDQSVINKKIRAIIQADELVKGIFVTNEKVFTVAALLGKHSRKDIMLIGYDFLQENIEYLKKDCIDFLICQKLQEQGYRAVMALYQKLVFNTDLEKVYYMPIDIVTRENYIYYNN
jgi:LacI family transcriptional regulator